MEVIKKNLPILLVFILTFSIRLYWIAQKDYLFCDSATSFSVSTPNVLNNEGELLKKNWDIYNFKTDYPYSVKELKKMMFSTGGTVKSTLQDVKSLYLKHYDPSHSNLYFIIMRIWNTGMDDDVNLKTLIWQGCSLNLLLFSLSFFVMYKLLALLFNDKKYVAIGLFIAFINTASISTTLLIREYQLQGLGFLIVTYIFAKIYLWLKEYKNFKIFSKKNVIIFALSATLYSLTGYYSLIYEALLIISLLFLINKYVRLNKTVVFKLLGFIFLTLIFILLFDPNYFQGFYEKYLVRAVLPLVFYELAEKQLITMSNILQRTLIYSLFLMFCCVLLFVAKTKKTANPLLLLLVGNAFVWTTCVFVMQPFYDVRYYTPAAPILTLLIVYFLSWFKFRYSLLACFIYLAFAIFPHTNFDNNSNGVNLYYVHDIYKSKFTNPSGLPVVILKYQWTLGSFLVYLQDNQIIEFINYIPDKSFKYKEYILIYGRYGTYDEQKVIFEKAAQKGNNIVKTDCTIYYDCFAVIDNREK